MTDSDTPERKVKAEEAPDSSELLRIAREDDVRTRKSMVRFIVGVSIGFLVAVAVMSVGVSIDEMWLFYLGMGIAVLGMFAIRIRL